METSPRTSAVAAVPSATSWIDLEVTAPFSDVAPPPAFERLGCRVRVEGDLLGTVELPVCDGPVPAAVLADAVAAELAWPLLERFFARTLYPGLTLCRGFEGTEIWRGAVRLAAGLPATVEAKAEELHDAIGWLLFLQELWGRPEWPDAFFYRPPEAVRAAGRAPLRRAPGRWIAVEASAELPEIEARGTVDVELAVGGAAVGRVEVAVRGRLPAADLRAALTRTAGFELCRVAVREGLLGAPFAGPPLRARLAAAAGARWQGPAETAPAAPHGLSLAPGWRRALGRALPAGGAGRVIARRAHGGIGSSASRLAVLPPAAAEEILAAAAVSGEPVFATGNGGGPARLAYAPDLFWRPSRRVRRRASAAASPLPVPGAYGRHHFESLFAAAPDPWRYDSAYEQVKYEQTLSLLPPGPLPRVLELACAEGHFTLRLAPRVGQLTAADLSEIALARAAERCRAFPNVRFLRLDLTRDPLPSGLDLVVCSEVLYYVGTREDLQAVARRLAAALAPGGHLLVAHAEVAADCPEGPAFDWGLPFGARIIGATLARTPGLRFVRELATSLYRIQLFRRERGLRLSFRSVRPVQVETAEHAPLEPAVAAFLRRDGSPPAGPEPVVTQHLPILLYHQVAPAGSAALSRYRVRPEVFAEQIRYLHESGFRGVGLDEWGESLARRQPLPGRAVLLTFDDGYRDFAEHAWPVLRRYGFAATVFLVAGWIGETNRWDEEHGEAVPLLSWDEIRRLHREGVRFGSHSATHAPLTALPVADVAREAARSRALLERGLSAPVTAFAYPYGMVDPVVQHLVGACGYLYGLSCRQRRSRVQDPPLLLPRIEVSGSDDLRAFLAKLAG